MAQNGNGRWKTLRAIYTFKPDFAETLVNCGIHQIFTVELLQKPADFAPLTARHA
jgi:hypothetical protein